MITRAGFIKAAVAAVVAAVAGIKPKPKPEVIYYAGRAVGKSLSMADWIHERRRLESVNYVIQNQAADELFTQMMLSRKHNGGVIC